MDAFFIDYAWAEAAPQQGGSGFLFMMIFFFILMYFVILRPQIKQSKEHKKLLESLSKGDEVIISNGLVGKIKEVGEYFISIEIAREIEVKVQKSAISSMLPKGTLKEL